MKDFMMKHPIVSMLMFESMLEAVCCLAETLVKGKGKFRQFRARRCVKEISGATLDGVEQVKEIFKKEKPLMDFHYCEKREPA